MLRSIVAQNGGGFGSVSGYQRLSTLHSKPSTQRHQFIKNGTENASRHQLKKPHTSEQQEMWHSASAHSCWHFPCDVITKCTNAGTTPSLTNFGSNRGCQLSCRSVVAAHSFVVGFDAPDIVISD